MKYYIDTEFYEKPGSIELISFGIVSEDGRALYFETPESRDLCKSDTWLTDNVLPHLQGVEAQLTRAEQREAIRNFIWHDKAPEFYGYYADYDWVVFCWIFGRMIDLPKHFPMYCIDLKQELDRLDLSIPDSMKPVGVHNALIDAHYHKRIHDYISQSQVA